MKIEYVLKLDLSRYELTTARTKLEVNIAVTVDVLNINRFEEW